MRYLLCAGILFSQLCMGLPSGEQVQVLEERQTVDLASQRAAKVKAAFEFAWNGYYTYAFPNDELRPVTNGFLNPRNGWGASAVDALSTAIVMKEKTIVNQILEHIATIDYTRSKNNQVVSVFETTIRYLGGMLSGYDFLMNVYPDLAINKTNVDILLQQSVNLANSLSLAFDTTTGIPNNQLFFNNRSQDESTAVTNGLATIGSLVLEWTHLSDLCGNATYGQLAQKGESYLLSPSPASDSPWPGLDGTNVYIENGTFADASGGWVGGDDSYYEYLIKSYVYDSTRFGHYKDIWVEAVESSMAYLASSPSPRPDVLWLATFNAQQTGNTSQHLACFDGGNFILGGSILGRQDILNFGLDLVAGCHEAYISTATGIAPESWSWNTSTIPKDQNDFYQNYGFYITDSKYILRPEVMESYYYAWQVTKNTQYQSWAWDAFEAITTATQAATGYSEIANVNTVGGGKKLNVQDSFLFAEVMKYAYLIQAPDAEFNVHANGTNTWVFNTEAHPFKVAVVTGPP